MSVDLIRFFIFVAILASLPVIALLVPAFRPYLRKNPIITFLLGISSGFPLTLLVATMTFWLAKVGIDTATIGFAVALGIPYTIKFLWAPLVDKLHLPILTKAFGQRRSWLFFVQALLFFSIWQLGASNPQPGNMTENLKLMGFSGVEAILFDKKSNKMLKPMLCKFLKF